MSRINTEVEVDLTEIIDLNLEGFLNLLEALVLADFDEEERFGFVLEDIEYKPVGVNEGMIAISVSADLVNINE